MKIHSWKEPHWSPHILAIRLTNIVLHKQREDPNIMSRGWQWETVVRGMTRIICERYCGLWGIKILRGCRCSDSEGTGTAVRICTDCAQISCQLQQTGDQFDVPSSICYNTQEAVFLCDPNVKYQEVDTRRQRWEFAMIVPGILATYNGRAINLMSPQAQLWPLSSEEQQNFSILFLFSSHWL